MATAEVPMEATKNRSGMMLPTRPAKGDGLIHAKTETCPACGSDLGKGILREFKRLKATGDPRTCPECPGQAPQTREQRRKAKVRAAIADAVREDPRPKLGRIGKAGARMAERQRLADQLQGLPGPSPEEVATAVAQMQRELESPAMQAAILEGAGIKPKPDTQIRAHGGIPATGRLHPGSLQELVAAFMRDHAAEEWSPTAIGRATGRSSGAIANALAKFEREGTVRETSGKPRRYQAVAK